MTKREQTVVLGVSYLTDASAVLLRGGRVVAAISEERLNRQKLWHGVPHQSIAWVLAAAGITMEDVDYITTHDCAALSTHRRDYFEALAANISAADLAPDVKQSQLAHLWKKFEHTEMVINERNPGYIREIEALERPVRRVNHHVAHAASAYYASGWDECWVLTADGWGTDGSSILMRARGGKLEKVAGSHYVDSLGYFYGSITKHLGFRPHRHEGKILGLAAHGNPETLAPIMRQMIGFDPAAKTFRGLMERGIYVPYFDNPNLAAYLTGEKREDVAAAAQRVLEEVVLAYVAALVPAGSKLCLAGGIFANVRLNQKILALPNITDLFVFPNMGDGGLAVGSVWFEVAEGQAVPAARLHDVYWGPEYSDREIVTALEHGGLHYKKIDDLPSAVAGLLKAGEVVARFAGRMEFGPRALGNRSVLYRPDDPDVNDWLNKHLQRTEFMPFAPVTLAEQAQQYYVLEKNVRTPAQYMTITCDCTDAMNQASPGVVHVDGTARPQIIEREQNPSYWDTVAAYYKLSGNPTLINTSFNMHEEPIVCSPEDAVRSFQAAQFNYMAIGNYLVTR